MSTGVTTWARRWATQVLHGWNKKTHCLPSACFSLCHYVNPRQNMGKSGVLDLCEECEPQHFCQSALRGVRYCEVGEFGVCQMRKSWTVRFKRRSHSHVHGLMRRTRTTGDAIVLDSTAYVISYYFDLGSKEKLLSNTVKSQSENAGIICTLFRVRFTCVVAEPHYFWVAYRMCCFYSTWLLLYLVHRSRN